MILVKPFQRLAKLRDYAITQNRVILKRLISFSSTTSDTLLSLLLKMIDLCRDTCAYRGPILLISMNIGVRRSKNINSPHHHKSRIVSVGYQGPKSVRHCLLWPRIND